MSTLLAEQPWMSSIGLGVIGVALTYAWLQTGKRWGIIAGGVCFLMIPGAFVLAENWQTEREKIAAILHDTAQAVQSNDHDRAVSVIADPDTRRQALSELPRYRFTLARVHQIRSIKIKQGGAVPTAVADTVVRVDVSSANGQFADVRILRKLELTFEKVDDRWMVVEYHHSPVVGGPDRAFAVTP